MEGRLTVQVLEWSRGPYGPMGEVLLLEPNGDSYPFFVKIVGEETEITGDPTVLDYLEDRYSSPVVCFTCRNALLQKEIEDEPC